MGLTLSQIAQNTASVTFQYEIVHEDGSRESQPVTIVYFPGRVTEKTLATMSALGTLDQASLVSGFEAFNSTLAGLIKSWDVLNDDGSMFPLEPVRLAELPVFFRIEVVNAILGDMRPEMIAPQM